MRVEFLTCQGCPNAVAARQLLKDCLAEAGIEVHVVDRLGAYPSPSVLIDGIDVMQPGEVVDGHACRVELPTRERILAALGTAAARRSGQE